MCEIWIPFLPPSQPSNASLTTLVSKRELKIADAQLVGYELTGKLLGPSEILILGCSLRVLF